VMAAIADENEMIDTTTPNQGYCPIISTTNLVIDVMSIPIITLYLSFIQKLYFQQICNNRQIIRQHYK